MNEQIEINDIVIHNRYRLIGQVKKIVPSKEGNGKVLKVKTSAQLPLQTWELTEVTLHQKGN